MKTRPLGNSGLNASVVGLGTWVLGGGVMWGRDTDDAESIRAIHAALDAGINLIDTAPAYGWGRSEEVVGKAIAGRRDQVILATKCGLWTEDDRGAFFTEFDGRIMRRSLRPDTLTLEIERSLQRLGVDCIDLYQTHWPSVPPDFTPIADTMACLLKLRDAGKIRALGVCNVSLDELKENLRCGDGAVVSDQLRYSMLHRDAEKDILPICSERGLAALTYMVPLGVNAAAAVLVGHAIGRGDFDGARREASAALACGVGFMALSALVLLSFPHTLAGIFSSDAGVVAIAAVLIPIAGVFQIFDGVQGVSSGILRGAGDTRVPMLINLLGYVVIGLPLGTWLCLGAGYGAQGMWWALVVALAAAAGALGWRVHTHLGGDLARIAVDHR